MFLAGLPDFGGSVGYEGQGGLPPPSGCLRRCRSLGGIGGRNREAYPGHGGGGGNTGSKQGHGRKNRNRRRTVSHGQRRVSDSAGDLAAAFGRTDSELGLEYSGNDRSHMVRKKAVREDDTFSGLSVACGDLAYSKPLCPGLRGAVASVDASRGTIRRCQGSKHLLPPTHFIYEEEL